MYMFGDVNVSTNECISFKLNIIMLLLYLILRDFLKFNELK